MSGLNKFLLFLLFITLIAVSGLWIMGGKKDDFSTSVVIDAHPSQVFPYLTQPDQLKKWIAGLEQVSEILPPPGEYDPAPIMNRTMVSSGNGSTKYQDKVIRFTPDELISIQSTNSLQILTSIFQLELKENRQTLFTYQVKSSSIGIGRLMAPLQASGLQQTIVDDARRLKEVVEREVPEWTGNTTDEASYQVPGFDSNKKDQPDPGLKNSSPVIDVEPPR